MFATACSRCGLWELLLLLALKHDNALIRCVEWVGAIVVVVWWRVSGWVDGRGLWELLLLLALKHGSTIVR